MLRIVKFKSAMSEGVWGLVGFSMCAGITTAAQLARDRIVPSWIARLELRPLTTLLQAVSGAFIAGYTGVLLSSTAIPIWGKGKYHIPAMSVCSAISSACAANSLVLCIDPAGATAQHKLERLEAIAAIGELAVNGTVNELAGAGARPLALSRSLILEEGLPAETLKAEVEAGGHAAREAGVSIIAGDTKVVERGHADGMYICTAGIGVRDRRASLSPAALRPGDRILLSGSIGEHGTAIMLARDEFELSAEVRSDTRSLWPAVDALLDAVGPQLRCLRDATRGGVASVLNELARSSSVAMLVREGEVPVVPAVVGAAEILGIDPMYVANEGKLVAFVAPEGAEQALAALRSAPGGEAAAEIGEVRTEPPGMVLVQTGFGGRRVMDQLVGDPLPRIC